MPLTRTLVVLIKQALTLPAVAPTPATPTKVQGVGAGLTAGTQPAKQPVKMPNVIAPTNAPGGQMRPGRGLTSPVKA